MISEHSVQMYYTVLYILKIFIKGQQLPTHIIAFCFRVPCDFLKGLDQQEFLLQVFSSYSSAWSY
jgi:hypothetical protein